MMKGEISSPSNKERVKHRQEPADADLGVKKRNILILGSGYFGTNFIYQQANNPTYIFYASTTNPKRVNSIKEVGAQEAFVWSGSDDIELRNYLTIADVVIVSIRSPTHQNEEIFKSLEQIANGLNPKQYLIYLSSIEVYPALSEAKEEDADPSRVQTKMEGLFQNHRNKCILRLSHIFGEGLMPETSAKRDYLMRMHLEKIFILTKGVLPGEGKDSVHLTHLKDLIAFVNYAIEHKVKGIYNLCVTLTYTRRELYDKLSEHFNMPKIQWDKDKPFFSHYLLPHKIATDKLEKIPFRLSPENYTFEALIVDTKKK